MAAQPGQNFDYIVVGAGSSGCVVASRLSEDKDARVLLLEAGGSDDNILIKMPLGFLKAMFRPEFNWGFLGEAEQQLEGRQLWIPRGRLLGGSSSINGMFYMRGHRRGYDEWAEFGCEGWSYADVLPYFIRSETSWRGKGKYHGDSGPLNIIPIDTAKLLHTEIMEAAKNAGFPTTDDINGDQQVGFARGEVTIDKKARRASTSRAYIDPVRGRPNLTVEINALTSRVVIENGKAVGVEYVQNGEKKIARAEREVILSGGAYNSPQMLMLSGVGPADDLKRMDIPPIVDLPGVGQNMIEHPCVMMNYEATKPVTFLNELRADKATLSVMRWFMTGKGPFATQINSANGIVKTDPSLDQPDIQFMCNPTRMDASIWFPGFTKAPEHVFNVGVVVLTPKSRGFVTLRSNDPSDKPRITTKILSDPWDSDAMRRGIRAAREIYHAKPMADLIGRELDPGDDNKTDAELDDFIRKTGQLTQHPVGTCKMGVDEMAVLDPQLRVRGVEGLRVVDASIMPTVPGGNTNAACIMIGEKAADLIRGQSLAPAAV